MATSRKQSFSFLYINVYEFEQTNQEDKKDPIRRENLQILLKYNEGNSLLPFSLDNFFCFQDVWYINLVNIMNFIGKKTFYISFPKSFPQRIQIILDKHTGTFLIKEQYIKRNEKGGIIVGNYHEKKHEHKHNCESILQKAFEKLLKEIFEDHHKDCHKDHHKDKHDCGCHS